LCCYDIHGLGLSKEKNKFSLLSLFFLYYEIKLIFHPNMFLPQSTLSIKGQTTIPAEIRETLGLKPNDKIVWISWKPGEVSLLRLPPIPKKGSWAEELCGKYADDSFDGVQSLLDSRKEDLILEERGYLSE
jgi:AbrB family looped-hinge helix DNA binding protein